MTSNDISRQLVKGLTVSRFFDISPSKDDPRSKRCKLELFIDGVTVLDMAMGLLAPEVIKVQNGNRKKWSSIPSGKVFKKTFKKPYIEDPTESYHREFTSMTPDQQQAEIARLKKLAKQLEQPNEPNETTSETTSE